MNGIFGAGPADQDYESELEDSAKHWEPTFSETAIARQWGLPSPAAPAQQVRSAPMPGPMPVAPVVASTPVRMPPKVAKVGVTIPKWLPWTLALAAVGALVYVVAKKPAPSPKLETPTI